MLICSLYVFDISLDVPCSPYTVKLVRMPDKVTMSSDWILKQMLLKELTYDCITESIE